MGVEGSQYGERWDSTCGNLGTMLTRSNSRNFIKHSKAKVIKKKNNVFKNVMKIFSLKSMNDLDSGKVSCISKYSTFSSTSSEKHSQYEKLVSGMYPLKVEARLLSKMTEIALNRANEWDLLGSYRILKQVLEVQKSSLGLDHNEVASTLYHIANVLQMSGESEHAPSVYRECFRILYPKRMNETNMDLASVLYEMAYIEFKKENFDVSKDYLEKLKQVEIHTLGSPNVKTLKLIHDVEIGREHYNNSINELRRSNFDALESLNDADTPHGLYDDPKEECWDT